MAKKVRFTQKNDVRILEHSKDEEYWRKTKLKTFGYIKYKSKVDFHELMKDYDYRVAYYVKIDRIKQHRQKTLSRLSYMNKKRNNPLYY